jgi:hypothetical protein
MMFHALFLKTNKHWKNNSLELAVKPEHEQRWIEQWAYLRFVLGMWELSVASIRQHLTRPTE